MPQGQCYDMYIGGDEMGYKVKWVEEHLGVTRKALRGFEEKGLMPKNTSGQYRDYTDEDIDRIWEIKLLQGMKFTLDEIVKIKNNHFYDFEDSIAQKVKQLEKEVAEKELYLGYSKTIKLLGKFPSRPKEMGSVKFDDFIKKSINEWNVNSDPQIKRQQENLDMILNMSEEELSDTDMGRMLDSLIQLGSDMSKWEQLLTEKVLPKAIVSRISLGPSHPEVQLLVKIMYESRDPQLENITTQEFARYTSSYYIVGDIARMREREYGKEGCKFIADAIAVFSGYKNYDALED